VFTATLTTFSDAVAVAPYVGEPERAPVVRRCNRFRRRNAHTLNFQAAVAVPPVGQTSLSARPYSRCLELKP